MSEFVTMPNANTHTSAMQQATDLYDEDPVPYVSGMTPSYVIERLKDYLRSETEESLPLPPKIKLNEIVDWMVDRLDDDNQHLVAYPGHTKVIAWSKVRVMMWTWRWNRAMRYMYENISPDTVSVLLDGGGNNKLLKLLNLVIDTTERREIVFKSILSGESPEIRSQRFKVANRLPFVKRPSDYQRIPDLVDQMVRKTDWKPYYVVLRDSGSLALQDFSILKRRTDLDREEDDRRLRFVMESLRRPLMFWYFVYPTPLYSKFSPMPKPVLEAVCEHHLDRIRNWDPSVVSDKMYHTYPEECATGFHDRFSKVVFEDEEAASAVYNKILDAMRIKHPQPLHLTDKKILEGGSLNNHFAVSVTMGTVLKNNALEKENEALKRKISELEAEIATLKRARFM